MTCAGTLTPSGEEQVDCTRAAYAAADILGGARAPDTAATTARPVMIQADGHHDERRREAVGEEEPGTWEQF